MAHGADGYYSYDIYLLIIIICSYAIYAFRLINSEFFLCYNIYCSTTHLFNEYPISHLLLNISSFNILTILIPSPVIVYMIICLI